DRLSLLRGSVGSMLLPNHFRRLLVGSTLIRRRTSSLECTPDPTCLRCSKPIQPGTTARYSRTGWTHVTCEAKRRDIRNADALSQLRRSWQDITDARGQIRETREPAGLPPELMVVATDEFGCLVHFNTMCEAVTGYQRSDVLGQPLIQLLVPEAWHAAMATH